MVLLSFINGVLKYTFATTEILSCYIPKNNLLQQLAGKAMFGSTIK